MAQKTYVETWFTKKTPPDKTIGEIIEAVRFGPEEARWRKLLANRLALILRNNYKTKVADLLLKDWDKAFSKNTADDKRKLMTNFNGLLRKTINPNDVIIADRTSSIVKSANNEPIKIKHFIVDDTEIGILLRERNSRFSALNKNIREQLAILPQGKSHGFYPGTDDRKEISATIHGIEKTLKSLGFVARYVKSEKAIFIVRKELINSKKKGE